MKNTYNANGRNDTARPQHCVTASHRKYLRRRTTHRRNFRCNMTSDNLLCDVIFAIRRRNAEVWFHPKSAFTLHQRNIEIHASASVPSVTTCQDVVCRLNGFRSPGRQKTCALFCFKCQVKTLTFKQQKTYFL